MMNFGKISSRSNQRVIKLEELLELISVLDLDY